MLSPAAYKGLSYREFSAEEADLYGGGAVLLHIYHKEWWGIRSATELLPGWKLAISAYESFDFTNVIDLVVNHAFTHVIFHGYSVNAADLAEAIFAKTDGGAVIWVVTHVAVSQFDNQFEIDMISVMLEQKRRSVVSKLFSVKSGFYQICDEFEKELLINTLPPWQVVEGGRLYSSALIPLTRGLRKNMQANHIALCKSSYELIFSTLDNAALGRMVSDEKVQYLGHVPQSFISKIMAAVGLVSNVTLTECQPMVLNEAVACGTPCLTGPLFLPFCADHPLRLLTEVADPNDVGLMIRMAERIKDIWHHDAQELVEMCRDYHHTVSRLSAISYAAALGG